MQAITARDYVPGMSPRDSQQSDDFSPLALGANVRLNFVPQFDTNVHAFEVRATNVERAMGSSKRTISAHRSSARQNFRPKSA